MTVSNEETKRIKKEMFEFRVKHNLSMSKFAKIAHITQQTVFNIENELTTPTKFTIGKIETAIENYDKKYD